jgi:hypothetical protein
MIIPHGELAPNPSRSFELGELLDDFFDGYGRPLR